MLMWRSGSTQRAELFEAKVHCVAVQVPMSWSVVIVILIGLKHTGSQACLLSVTTGVQSFASPRGRLCRQISPRHRRSATW